MAALRRDQRFADGDAGRDELVQMFDQAFSGAEGRARRKLDQLLVARAKASERKLDLLEEILTVAADESVAESEVGGLLRRGIGMDRLRAARRDPRDRVQRDHGHLALIDARFTYLREFAPHVVAPLEFAGSPGFGASRSPADLR
ncbi:hypothetical protein ACFFQW_38300 [Umezawaea endophytica]|uniref:Uncharacterized protein n=1 Tax=Umezawaea endophytica TaxID=1654476 RepID=A0A9X2VVV1_9PSEU|nr:hypothetical protein [Umezawaea endophytica]MCS7483798.1 hypothetical protein [Umezawaea endophytica]